MNQLEDIGLKQMIDDADMILIGLGSEFDEYGIREEEDTRLCELLQGTEGELFIPMIQDDIRERNGKKKELDRAILRLSELIEGKNYYVVTLGRTSSIENYPWKDNRLVNMEDWNNYFLKKGEEENTTRSVCRSKSQASEQLIVTLKELFAEEIQEASRQEQELLNLPGPVADAMKMIKKKELSECVSQKAEKMIEKIPISEAAEKNWSRYEKWLQGTMNRKLLLLELGVGLPGNGSFQELYEKDNLIRNPFERIAFLNQKAQLCRINGTLSDLPEKLVEKGVGLSENAIEWLQKV